MLYLTKTLGKNEADNVFTFTYTHQASSSLLQAVKERKAVRIRARLLQRPRQVQRQVVAQDGQRRPGLQGGVSPQQASTASAHSLVVGGPLPDADAVGAVLDGLLHVQPLGPGELGGDHHVDLVPALDAVVKAGQQAVGVRGR